jgi:hypothetical protein
MTQPNRRLTALAAALLAVAEPSGLAQRQVPPDAALDVRIPAPPVPVRIGGATHLVYELHLTNFAPDDVELTSIDIEGSADGSAPLARYEGTSLASHLGPVGRRTEGADTRLVRGGARVVFFAWLSLDQARESPETLHHLIAVRAINPAKGESGLVRHAVEVRRDVPVALGPPLRGGPWVGVYDPSLHNGHRRVIFAIGGRARIPSRFAIDWIKLDESGRMWRDDASVFTNWYGYDAEVLAVSDGVVAAVSDGMAEQLPKSAINLGNEAGNFVALDVGGSRYVFYEHLKPGSIGVKRGDKVRARQAIARLGGSGSVSSGPHLHFHVSDAPSPLGAEGIPFVFQAFTQLGGYSSLGALSKGPWTARDGGPTARSLEMPLPQTVVRF